jgi:tRNA 2-thiouridine synthesizing protein E
LRFSFEISILNFGIYLEFGIWDLEFFPLFVESNKNTLLHMPILEIESQTFEVDGDGFLQQPEVWNEEVARMFAINDGTGELNDKHWAVISFIREHWLENDMAPMVRKICQHTGLKLREIYQLFPMGPARGACKIAGLPKPDGCV